MLIIKNQFFIWIFISFIFLSNLSNAQYATCTPDPSVTDTDGFGIRVPVDMPVSFNGDPYNSVLTIIPPAKADTWGVFNITITKIQIVEISDLPTGLSWESNSNNEDDYLYASEKYCILVEGTPNTTPGIRKMDVFANAWIRTIFEYAAPGNPQNGGDITFTVCNELNLDLGENRNISTNEHITLSANQNTSYHTYIWSNGSTNETLEISGADLGVGTHEISVAVYDSVGTTGYYAGRVSNCVKTDVVNITIHQGNFIGMENRNRIKIFPNPANEKIIITQTEDIRNTKLDIFSLNGKLVSSMILIDNETILDISTLPSGLYFAKLSGNDINDVLKLVIK